MNETSELSTVSEKLTPVLNELRTLSQPEREFIVMRLAETLDDEPDEEFAEELERRLVSHQTGASLGVPMDEAFRQLRERFK